MRDEKIVIIIISVIAAVILFCLFLNNYLLASNKVFTYGKQYTLSEVLNEKEEYILTTLDTKNKYLNNYLYKRAITKDRGSTIQRKIKIFDNTLIDIGNRNLIEINDKLYVYLEK